MPKKTDSTLKNRFLALLADHCNVTRAAEGAGLSRAYAYKLRDEDPDFAAAWDEAVEAGVDALEEEARRRALAGSDTLLIFLLKSHRPQKYRDNVRLDAGGQVTLRVVYGAEDDDNNQSA